MEPIDNKYYQAGFGGAFKGFWANYVNFKGRSSRSEFWWWVLWLLLIGVVGFIALMMSVGMAGLNAVRTQSDVASIAMVGGLLFALLIGGALNLALLLPSIALTIRRYRDAGVAWWAFLIQVVVYVVTLSFFDKQSIAYSLLMVANGLTTFVIALLPAKN